MMELICLVAIQPTVIRSSIAPLSTQAHLQLFGGAHCTVIMDPSLLEQLLIASGTSPMGHPLLFLPTGSAYSVCDLWEFLLPDEPLPPMPDREVIIVASDSEDDTI